MAYRKGHHRLLARGQQLEPRLPLAAIAFIPHDVSEERVFPDFVDAADIDGDNDMDLIAASDQSIQWYENVDGQGNFGPESERIIAEELHDDVDEPYSLAAADLDGDGDVDVLAGGRTPRLAWYENTTGEGTFGPPQAIANMLSPTIRSVAAADLDGDGDMDALAATADGAVFWYENTDGRGQFGSQTVIGSSGLVVFATDVHPDGDLDVLYMATDVSTEGMRQSKVVWRENLDGRATFGQLQQFTIGSTLTSVAIADLDGDGDPDVIAEPSSGMLTWYENDLRIVGDTNGDEVFNQLDIVQVLQAGKYGTGLPATWVEGDWNADAVFDQLDIVAALQDGNYDPT